LSRGHHVLVHRDLGLDVDRRLVAHVLSVAYDGSWFASSRRRTFIARRPRRRCPEAVARRAAAVLDGQGDDDADGP
jgi:hypothetical protein